MYVHYATQGDLLILSQNKINVTGKIAIARQGTMMITDQVGISNIIYFLFILGGVISDYHCSPLGPSFQLSLRLIYTVGETETQG